MRALALLQRSPIAAVASCLVISLPVRAQAPEIIAESAEWMPWTHSLAIEPGGIFDFSFLADAPAGKHGPITITRQGHFEFADQPGVRARFWGVNLCFSANFLSKEQADQLAENLWRSGYNTVRLHHFDGLLARPGAEVSHELDPEKLDQLDYLFAALKQRGIYISIDLFSSRTFTAQELVSFGLDPKGVRPGLRFKAVLPD